MSHLILADPWGFPEMPTDVATRYNVPWYIKGLYNIFKHFNPLAAFRAAGPFSPSMFKRLRPELIRKFGDLFETEEENFKVISDYVFHCNAQSPT